MRVAAFLWGEASAAADSGGILLTDPHMRAIPYACNSCIYTVHSGCATQPHHSRLQDYKHEQIDTAEQIQQYTSDFNKVTEAWT